MNILNKYIFEKGIINYILKYKEPKAEEILKLLYEIIHSECYYDENKINMNLKWDTNIEIYIITCNHLLFIRQNYIDNNYIEIITIKFDSKTHKKQYVNKIPTKLINKTQNILRINVESYTDIYSIISKYDIVNYRIISSSLIGNCAIDNKKFTILKNNKINNLLNIFPEEIRNTTTIKLKIKKDIFKEFIIDINKK
jgi:hypothetical protein